MGERFRLFMLDTNTASYIIKGKPDAVRENLLKVPMASVCISSITQAELLHGVAKKPEAKNLFDLVNEFLLRVEILPWNSDAAKAYAHLRAACEKKGMPLGAMDMLIAAHSLSIGAVLVTSDRAFHRIGDHLDVIDWLAPPA